jgi:hypothetical protein
MLPYLLNYQPINEHEYKISIVPSFYYWYYDSGEQRIRPYDYSDVSNEVDGLIICIENDDTIQIKNSDKKYDIWLNKKREMFIKI